MNSVNYRNALVALVARLFARSVRESVERRQGLGPCLTWTGARTSKGGVQGQITCRGLYDTPQKVHRIAWELAKGPIQAGFQLNHECDNGLCIDVAHMYLGTQAQNMQDASERGRFNVGHRTRKFTPDQRVELHERLRGSTWSDVKSVAAQFGVTPTCIHLIKVGRFVRPATEKGDAHV